MSQNAFFAEMLTRLQTLATWRKIGALALILGLAFGAVAVWIWPAWAAIQLEYFIVFPSEQDVTLQWATVAEYDLSGFEILCKREGELDNAYHVIGDVAAEGSPQAGASYVFPIMEGLERGVAYCFRLREISINGEPGDIFDRCGYGLGIAPTPAGSTFLTDTAALRATQNALQITSTAIAAANIATAIAGANATIEVLRATAAVTATPTLTTALQLAPTLTAIALISPTLTALAQPTVVITATLTPTATGVISALQPVSLTLTATSAEFAATQTAIAGGGSLLEETSTPTFTPIGESGVTPPPSPTPTLSPLSVESGVEFETSTPTFTPLAASPLGAPTPTSSLTTTNSLAMQASPTANPPTPSFAPGQTEMAAPAATVASSAPAGAEVAAAPIDTPLPPYIILTSTPTPQISPTAPTVTPLPPATATPAGLNLANLMAPTTQNLTLMLLCFTFFAASGLGVLGLITSVIYMRSQGDRRGDEDDHQPPW